MSQHQELEISEKEIQQVTTYAQENYKSMKDKTLLISKLKGCYAIRSQKDQSPLILGLTILGKVQ